MTWAILGPPIFAALMIYFGSWHPADFADLLTLVALEALAWGLIAAACMALGPSGRMVIGA